jgi:hypothetical protein
MITFNPIASTILKWLRFRFVWWMHYLQHLAFHNNGLGWDCLALLGFQVISHTIFSCCNHGNQGMYFTKSSKIELN